MLPLIHNLQSSIFKQIYLLARAFCPISLRSQLQPSSQSLLELIGPTALFYSYHHPISSLIQLPPFIYIQPNC